MSIFYLEQLGKTFKGVPFLAGLCLLAASTPFCAQCGVVTCNNNPADHSRLQRALKSAAPGATIAVKGTCALGASQIVFGSGLTIQGAGSNGNTSGHGSRSNTIINYNGPAGYALMSAGSGNTINDITFNGGGLNLTSELTGGWTITNNTFENITNIGSVTNAAAIYISGIIGPDSKGRKNAISNNQFTNIWNKGYPTLNRPNNDEPDSISGCGIWWYNGIAETIIDGNFFSQIGFNAIKGFNDGMYNPLWDHRGTGVVISNNDIQLYHRIGIEVQGCGRGGCNGVFVPLDGSIVSGNFIHDPAPMANSTWPSSLLLGGSHSQVINNTMTLNTTGTSCYDHAYGIEGGMRGGITNGNVVSSVMGVCAGSPDKTYGSDAYVSDSYGAGTNYYQNNLLCGPGQPQALGLNLTAAKDIFQYNYQAANCPTSGNLAVSNLSVGFVSAKDQSISKGMEATWSVAVISILSVRKCEFFIDGSNVPVVVQQLQDINSNFGNDRQWRYHAKINTAALVPGKHTITAEATDAAATKGSARQNFTVH
jgi:hypothetical protein